MLDELDAATHEASSLQRQLDESLRDAKAAWSRWQNASRIANDLMDARTVSYAKGFDDFALSIAHVRTRTTYSLSLGGSEKSLADSVVRTCNGYVEVESLVVWDEDQRGRGIGRTLMAVIQNLTQSEIRLDSSDESVGFYKAIGFTPIGNKRFYRKYCGTEIKGLCNERIQDCGPR